MVLSSKVSTAFKGGALFVWLFVLFGGGGGFGESGKLEKRRGVDSEEGDGGPDDTKPL